MVETQLLQLVKDDFAPHLLGRGDRPAARVAAQDAEHPLDVAARTRHVAEAVDGGPDRGEQREAEARLGMRLDLLREPEQRSAGRAAYRPAGAHRRSARSRRPTSRRLAASQCTTTRSTSRSRCSSSMPGSPFAASNATSASGARRGEAEPGGDLVDRAAPLEHRQQHLGAHAPLDVTCRARLDHVRYRDARRLGERVLRLVVEALVVVDDPDRADPVRARADRDRGARLDVVDLRRPALEHPAQRRAVRRHHAGRREHPAVQRAHAGRVGNLPPEDRAAARRRRSAGRRGSSRRAPGGLGSSIVTAPPTMPAIAFARAKRSPSGTPAIPPRASWRSRSGSGSANACSCVHVISSGTERTRARRRAAFTRELRQLRRRLEDDGRGARLRSRRRSTRRLRASLRCTPTASTTASREIAVRSPES